MQVVDIMRVNVEKVLERDKKLTELDDRAGQMSDRISSSSSSSSSVIFRVA